MSQGRRAWSIFGVCVAALAGVMLWITAAVLELERAEATARADADDQSALRLAMWRMDSWLAPLLAREAARPHWEYQAYYPQQAAYDKVYREIEPGEVLTPSPLLTFRSELFPLHFQCDQDGRLTSPQVPTGNQRDLAEASLPAAVIAGCAARLESLRGALHLAELTARIDAAETRMVSHGCTTAMRAPPAQDDLGQNEYQSRAQSTTAAKLARVSDPPPWARAASDVELGALLPLWLDRGPDGAAQLVFARRVRVRGETLLQGVLADWPRLSEAMRGQLAGLFDPGAVALERADRPTAEQEGRMLATVPALLNTPAVVPSWPAWSPTRTVLAAAWLALLLAAAATGITLRSTLALGERRARFASAVTHELRTPLTTFRMYSEMLAHEMVADPAQRATYFATLEREADRLSRLVENVLCYARLEEGRYRGRRERLAVAELLARVTPPLRERAADAAMELRVHDRAAAARIEVDADAVAQVLFNLVDNACKYARDGAAAALDLEVEADGDWLSLAVRDRGPGIPKTHRKAVFRPFERGARAAGDNATPGVGLGLALARGLARDLGGTLELDPHVTDGARFVLRIPAAG